MTKQSNEAKTQPQPFRIPWEPDCELTLSVPAEKLRQNVIAARARFLLASILLISIAWFVVITIPVLGAVFSIVLPVFFAVAAFFVFLYRGQATRGLSELAEDFGVVFRAAGSHLAHSTIHLFAVSVTVERSWISRVVLVLSGEHATRGRVLLSRIVLSIALFASAVPTLWWMSTWLDIGSEWSSLLRVPAIALIMTLLVVTALMMVGGALLALAHSRGRGGSPWSGELRSLSSWSPRPSRPTAHALTIVHMSDLHITDGSRERAEGGAGGNAVLSTLVAKHQGVLQAADLILLTGDVTDSGGSFEWQSFFEIVHEDWFLSRLVFVPGNHDVNITDPRRRLVEERPGLPARKLRIIRTMAAMDYCFGERAYTIATGTPGRVRDLLALHAQKLNSATEWPFGCTWLDGSRSEEGLWKKLFPIAVEIGPAVVFILNSCAVSSHIATNAFGMLNPEELARLDSMRQIWNGRPHLIALHHHIALPSFLKTTVSASFQARFMFIENGADLTRMLSRESIVVFHGHRHVSYLGSLDNLDIVSAPSTTLGDESAKTGPGFFVYQVEAFGCEARIRDRRWCGL